MRMLSPRKSANLESGIREMVIPTQKEWAACWCIKNVVSFWELFFQPGVPGKRREAIEASAHLPRRWMVLCQLSQPLHPPCRRRHRAHCLLRSDLHQRPLQQQRSQRPLRPHPAALAGTEAERWEQVRLLHGATRDGILRSWILLRRPVPPADLRHPRLEEDSLLEASLGPK